ncbi:MAG: Cobalt ABC transporter, ATPase subunit [Methanomicrobiales archaeon 53_19]|uniref:ATP-binding cassette domain-containing protein n=1 Tax=Methanocalculus sp. TaxID=2004547 RepID=UPI0007481AC8|nr:ATP-binding cassette domain-containing protein [Methanocalculus sp.]KUK70838.1 MAG: Cobalt ABC transporter, ATPase subunit [Methanocalculus sp. 52_23]KUL04033.1 MAG: Cobalt ABC transporter, ATPase subunit [Methanomicrobiales archaeon 53_19]HIJ06777.1 ATP-binding cassette domain-containing protein [Methanocalculus sp.]
MPAPAIEFKDLTFAYTGHPDSLKNVSISLKRGSRTALVGPNGAGKTTLLLMCNGTLRPTSGEVLVAGESIQYSSRQLREVRRKVGMVFQNSDSQLFAPTVYQDVAFGPLNLGLGEEEIRQVVSDALFAVGLTGYERRPPHHLSGGEKKRAAIAGVLAMKPEILIFDEPTSSLDPAGAAEVMDLLEEINQQGVTILLSTHDVELAYSWADDVVLIEGGEILMHAPPRSVFCDADLMRRAHLTQPAVLSLHHHLARRGIMKESEPPAGLLEMAQRIEEMATTVATPHAPAPIYLIDCSLGLDGTLPHLMETVSPLRIGVMGTTAKRHLAGAEISADLTYGVIDASILHALRQEPVVIVTSGGMIDRVHKRIAEFCEESTIPLSLRPVGGHDTAEEC